MAYASSITVTQPRTGHYVVTITETEAAPASEMSFAVLDPAGDGSQPALPVVGRVITRRAALTAGTGSSLDPILGNASDPANAASWVYENDSASNPIHDVPAGGIPYDQSVSTFYHRSVVNNHTDNSVTTWYYVVGGWE